jgi:hypothetical protein
MIVENATGGVGGGMVWWNGSTERVRGMVDVNVKTEEDSPRGWRFEVELSENGTRKSYDVTLSWSDYDLWSHGQFAPERVVKAAFKFLLEREPMDAILAKFDCAVIRRYFPEVDRELAKLL